MQRLLIILMTAATTVAATAGELRTELILSATLEAETKAVEFLNCIEKSDILSCKTQLDLDRVMAQNEELIQISPEILNLATDTFSAAVLKDEEKLKELEDIVHQNPKSEYHYKQILNYAELKIKNASYQMKKFLAILPEMNQAHRNFNELLKNSSIEQSQIKNDSLLYVEKWHILAERIRVSLAAPLKGTEEKDIETILIHSRKGSVVYSVAASTDKISGLLPFFCEEENKSNVMLYCNKDAPEIKFDIGLIKKILGNMKEAPYILNIEKIWTDRLPVVEMISGFFSDIKLDEKNKSMTISYYDRQICIKSGEKSNFEVGQILNGTICLGKSVTRRNIASKKAIEAAFFEMIGIKDESLKLYANDKK